MSFNNHRKIINPEWKQERKGVDATEVADVLKDNVNNYRNDREQLRAQEIEKNRKEMNVSSQEAEKSKNEISQDRIFARKHEIAQAKLMVNADKDFAVRKSKDAFGLARIGKDEVKDLPVASLFSADLKKIPSSRRRRIKARRKKELNLMEKSNKFKSKSGMFKGRGKNIKMKKIKIIGFSKQERLQKHQREVLQKQD